VCLIGAGRLCVVEYRRSKHEGIRTKYDHMRHVCVLLCMCLEQCTEADHSEHKEYNTVCMYGAWEAILVC
jgi:hypothetical protein